MDERSRIASVEAVHESNSVLFRVRERGDDAEPREAILLGNGDGVFAYLNYCQHFTHIRLDKGSGAPLRNGEVVCANHGAMFDVESGECTFGPCEGAFLNPLEVAVEDGAVYLADGDHEFVGVGPIEEEEDFDLTSTSNVEF